MVFTPTTSPRRRTTVRSRPIRRQPASLGILIRNTAIRLLAGAVRPTMVARTMDSLTHSLATRPRMATRLPAPLALHGLRLHADCSTDSCSTGGSGNTGSGCTIVAAPAVEVPAAAAAPAAVANPIETMAAPAAGEAKPMGVIEKAKAKVKALLKTDESADTDALLETDEPAAAAPAVTAPTMAAPAVAAPAVKAVPEMAAEDMAIEEVAAPMVAAPAVKAIPEMAAEDMAIEEDQAGTGSSCRPDHDDACPGGWRSRTDGYDRKDQGESEVLAQV